MASASQLRGVACPVRVACVGDSLTRGDGLHEHPPAHRVATTQLRSHQLPLRQRGSYPAFLGRLLGDGAVEVRNYGHGGATACNASRERGPPYARVREFAAALRYKPHVVIVMLGTNDAKSHLWYSSGCGPQGTRRSLTSIIHAFQTAASPPQLIMLLQPPDLLAQRVFGIRQTLLPGVRDAIAKVSRSTGVVLHDSAQHIPALPSLYTSDGLHLSANGSALLACTVFNRLRSEIDGIGSLSRRCRVTSDGMMRVDSRPRSCWDPFCERPLPSPYDDPAERMCVAESGIGAPFLFTGMPCRETANHQQAQSMTTSSLAGAECERLWHEYALTTSEELSTRPQSLAAEVNARQAMKRTARKRRRGRRSGRQNKS